MLHKLHNVTVNFLGSCHLPCFYAVLLAAHVCVCAARAYCLSCPLLIVDWWGLCETEGICGMCQDGSCTTPLSKLPCFERQRQVGHWCHHCHGGCTKCVIQDVWCFRKRWRSHQILLYLLFLGANHISYPLSQCVLIPILVVQGSIPHCIWWG